MPACQVCRESASFRRNCIEHPLALDRSMRPPGVHEIALTSHYQKYPRMQVASTFIMPARASSRMVLSCDIAGFGRLCKQGRGLNLHFWDLFLRDPGSLGPGWRLPAPTTPPTTRWPRPFSARTEPTRASVVMIPGSIPDPGSAQSGLHTTDIQIIRPAITSVRWW
eukprot:358140-Chlamydomonas_euryale.AAC.3